MIDLARAVVIAGSKSIDELELAVKHLRKIVQEFD